MRCCWFDGHKDKIVTYEPESGYDETEVQPQVHDSGGQLGLDATFPRRPKYMQQKTDDRLQQQAFHIDDAVNALIDSYVGLL